MLEELVNTWATHELMLSKLAMPLSIIAATITISGLLRWFPWGIYRRAYVAKLEEENLKHVKKCERLSGQLQGIREERKRKQDPEIPPQALLLLRHADKEMKQIQGSMEAAGYIVDRNEILKATSPITRTKKGGDI